MSCFSQFLFRNLVTFLLSVFSFFTAFLFRLRRGDDYLEKRLDFYETEHDGETANDFSFKFRFPTYEELAESSLSSSSIEKPEEFDEVSRRKHFDGETEESDREFLGAENKSQSEFEASDEFINTDSDFTSAGLDEHLQFLTNRLGDEFLSDDDFGGEFNVESLKDFDDDDDDVIFAGDDDPEFLSENDFRVTTEFEESDDEESKNAKKSKEHRDVIEKLASELRKVRASASSTLPTILEEESTEMEDLKPLKIGAKSFKHQGSMAELRKFYKTYRERMRKFDILTYQKLYAIGLLQKEPQKDLIQLLSPHKSSVFTLKSLLSQSTLFCKQKIHDTDPVEKFVTELRSDLEAVYVGQTCLSWEFLRWQHTKALELFGSNQLRTNRFDEVSSELQQFIVLILRFIEDETFQGTRIQHYVKCRIENRNLLQVPLIREDSLKDKKKPGKCNAVTSDVIVEQLEECIRIFWLFVKADKQSSGTTMKQAHNAEDTELLREVTKTLHKKQRKLKEKTRIGENSIFRSIRMCQEDDKGNVDRVLYFFSQVDMMLVSRVLNMSAITTDQLLWCHNKLSRIKFSHRKIHIDPSFSLFPCSY